MPQSRFWNRSGFSAKSWMQGENMLVTAEKYKALVKLEKGKSSIEAAAEFWVPHSTVSLRQKNKQSLKLVSAIFYQIFIVSPNDSPLKTMKNVFYFIEKALFVLKIFKFLWFFPFLSALSRFKRANGSGIIYDVMKWLA